MTIYKMQLVGKMVFFNEENTSFTTIAYLNYADSYVIQNGIASEKVVIENSMYDFRNFKLLDYYYIAFDECMRVKGVSTPNEIEKIFIN